MVVLRKNKKALNYFSKFRDIIETNLKNLMVFFLNYFSQMIRYFTPKFPLFSKKVISLLLFF